LTIHGREYYIGLRVNTPGGLATVTGFNPGAMFDILVTLDHTGETVYTTWMYATPLEEERRMKREFSYIEIQPDQLVHSDLKQEAMRSGTAYRITIREKGLGTNMQLAEAVLKHGRLGIAWGADATWADVSSLESGIEMWLNDGEAWEAAN
jgi:hypothetical protein